MQRQKESQEAQAAQEARHEQAKRKAKLEAGFAEVNANSVDQALMVYALLLNQLLMSVLHDCPTCICQQSLASLRKSQDRKGSAQSSIDSAFRLSIFVGTTDNFT